MGLFFKKFLLYLAFCAVAITITYINYYLRIPVDLTPIFFLSVIISFGYGFFYSMLFVIIVSLPPKIFSGADFGIQNIVYVIINIMVNLFLVSVWPSNIILFGIIGAVVYCLMSAVISGIIKGEIEKELLVSIINIGINLFYFLNFSSFLLGILV